MGEPGLSAVSNDTFLRLQVACAVLIRGVRKKVTLLIPQKSLSKGQ